jgi:hypothetical protein
VAVGFDKRRGRAWKERASETQEFFETALRENSHQGKTTKIQVPAITVRPPQRFFKQDWAQLF